MRQQIGNVRAIGVKAGVTWNEDVEALIAEVDRLTFGSPGKNPNIPSARLAVACDDGSVARVDPSENRSFFLNCILASRDGDDFPVVTDEGCSPGQVIVRMHNFVVMPREAIAQITGKPIEVWMQEHEARQAAINKARDHAREVAETPLADAAEDRVVPFTPEPPAAAE